MDSSLIAAMIHRIHPEKRHSFSIGFADKDIDERAYQSLMVSRVMSEHHEAVFDWQDIADQLKKRFIMRKVRSKNPMIPVL
ncbi:MAG: hypothetical protein HC887_07230 [Desulfobacteraceae bacterium]|nr:hypothetical protein [Desulfobacteraceae bacterium]